MKLLNLGFNGAHKRTVFLAVSLVLAGLLLASCDSPDNPVNPLIDAAKPTITTQPQSGDFDVGEEQTFPLSVTATSTDGGTLGYQWYSNDSNSTTGGTATGTNSATLTLNKTDFATADKNGHHYFYVVVTNTNTRATGRKTDSVTSHVATVTVNGAGGVHRENAQHPFIDTQPEGGEWNVIDNETFTLEVEASVTDNGDLRYRWYSNTGNSTTGGTETGTDSATLTLNKTDYTANGSHYFYVIVTNTIEDNDDGGVKANSTTSDVATVNVNGVGGNIIIYASQPSITAQPQSGTFDVGMAETFQLTVTAGVTDGGTLGYRWYSTDSSTDSTDGTAIGGANSASLTLNDTDYTSNGHYYFYVIVTNTITDNGDGGTKTASRTSTVATVTVTGNIPTKELVNGVWSDGELTADISTVMYTFDATAGTTYYVWWNDRDIGATPRNKTADIEVWAKYSDGTDIFDEDAETETGYVDSGWIDPQFFTADRSQTVFVEVHVAPPYSHLSNPPDNHGTFAVAYSTASIRPGAAVPKTITAGQWADDTIATDDIHVYTMSVTANQTYYVWWNQKTTDETNAGDGSKTADVQVQARYSDEDLIFALSSNNWYEEQWADTAWTESKTFTADRTGTVSLRVRPAYRGKSEDSSGTYGIVYSTTGTRPVKTATLISVTPNGSSSGTPTTELTLLFNQAVYGLSAADITLELSGLPYDVTKGELRGNGPSYTLGFGSPVNGTLVVTVGGSELFDISGSPKTVTVYGGAGNIKVTPLTVNQWVYDDLTATSDVHWYTFNVNTGTTYRIWWDDDEENISTADIETRVYANGAWVYGSATEWKDENGWTSVGYSYTPTVAGTVYVSVRPWKQHEQMLGTYGVVYSTGTTRPNVVLPDIPVTLSSVTANGSSSGAPTTTLTLTFDKVIPGLAAANITLALNSPFGVTKGDLTGNGPVYTLGVGPSMNGTLTVTVEKVGYNITGSPKGVTVYGNSSITVTPLVENQWADGNLTAGTSIDWYSFAVTSGRTYRIWWNDSAAGPSPRDKTGDVVVTACYADGTNIFGDSQFDEDSGWFDPQRFTARANDTVYVNVVPFNNDGDYKGTYGIVYSTGTNRPAISQDPGVTFTTLVAGQWANGNLTDRNSEDWYQFNVTSGRTYRIWWNDSDDGPTPKTKTADVVVTASYATGANIFGNSDDEVDQGWTTPRSFTANATGTVHVMVMPYAKGSGFIGTYGIVYTDNNATRPNVTVENPNATPTLVAGTWANGNLTAGASVDTYEFNVTSGRTYRIWWNDKDDGPTPKTKTADVVVTASYVAGANIFGNSNTEADQGWTTPQSFTPTANGTVRVTVIPWSKGAGNIGTYGIVYTENSATRPTP